MFDTLDVQFLGRPGVIASCLLHTRSGYLLIDPGPASCLASLKRALADRGIAVRDLTAVLLTHIHLDHAGAVGSLLREHPELVVYVHEKGARHLIDPSKLIESARRLYGDRLDALWGEFLSVPASNLRSLAGNERLEFADRRLMVAYTPGHASHHVSYFDPDRGIAFVGDTAGVRLRAHGCVMPPTPPPDIDLEAWNESLEKIRHWHPAALFITHFGLIEDPASHLERLAASLKRSAQLVRNILLDARLDEEGRAREFARELLDELGREMLESDRLRYELAVPLEHCWMGLARYWRKRGLATPVEAGLKSL